MKSASADFRYFTANKLDEIVFKSSPADTNVWLRPAIKTDNEEYYDHVLMYVDSILAISIDPTEILKSMEGKTVKYNNGKIAPPEMYLGAILKRKMINRNICCTITSYDYAIAAVQTI